MNVRKLSTALWGAWELYGLLSWLGGLALSNAAILTLWDDYKAQPLAVQILGGAGLALFMVPLSALLARFIGGLTASDTPTATGASQAVAQTNSPSAVAVHIQGNVIGGDYLAVTDEPPRAQESSQATQSPDTWVALAVERGTAVQLRNQGYTIPVEGVAAWTEEIRSWTEQVIGLLAQIDPVEAEMFRFIGNMPARQYQGITVHNSDHLLYLRVIDERLVRLESIIRNRPHRLQNQ